MWIVYIFCIIYTIINPTYWISIFKQIHIRFWLVLRTCTVQYVYQYHVPWVRKLLRWRNWWYNICIVYLVWYFDLTVIDILNAYPVIIRLKVIQPYHARRLKVKISNFRCTVLCLLLPVSQIFVPHYRLNLISLSFHFMFRWVP